MDELRCNSLKCRKGLALEGAAVVTTCSHIFCVQCANDLFSSHQICPACETALPDNDDAVQTALNPPDAYKTSVLSGLAPNLIFEIASRALNFYTYQVQQESAFQALVTKNAQERIAVLESQCSNLIREATSELTLLQERVASAERDLELERRKVRDLHETHKSNAKAYNKLKAQYDKAQQRALLSPANNLGTAFAASQPLQQPQQQPQPHQAFSGAPLRGSSSASNHSRATQNWNATFGGAATGPLTNNPGNSTARPRHSLQDQNQNAAPQSGGLFASRGLGSGAGQQEVRYSRDANRGGIAAMPNVRRHGSSGSGGSGGSGGAAGMSARKSGGQSRAGQGGAMPGFLGQGGAGAGPKGGFRPAGFAN